MQHTILTIFFPRLQNSLGIRTRAETMTCSSQGTLQLFEVIDLTIEDNPDCPISIGHRLMSARQIDDAQAVKCKADVAVPVEAGVIRPPMSRPLPHAD